MTDLIRTINRADFLAAMWRGGEAVALAVEAELTGMGFYSLEFGDRVIVGYLNGVRWEL